MSLNLMIHDAQRHAEEASGWLLPRIDTNSYSEVCMEEGSLLVQHPMLVHSQSENAGAVPSPPRRPLDNQ